MINYIYQLIAFIASIAMYCKDDYKKISYAASFGVNEIDGVFANNVKRELKKFKCVSVREEQGAQIVKELLDSDCAVVLDPTMLITQEEWRMHTKKIAGLPAKYKLRRRSYATSSFFFQNS